MIDLLSEAPKTVLPGLFWWAINLGRYLNDKPVLERLKYRELLEVLMHRIISLEPNFYYSGPYRFFGSLYTRIPGIELSQAKTYFDQAIQANPEYLGNLVSMAEYYHQKSGNREMFNKTLETVLNTDINLYPELMAENFLYQKRARNLLRKEASLFE
jgi:tetratricopeptide (TPR) repeat protein